MSTQEEEVTEVVIGGLRVKCLLLYSLDIMHSEWSNEVLAIQIEYKYMYGLKLCLWKYFLF